MAFIGKDQRIVRQIFKQGWRWFAGFAAGQIARIILNPGATACGFQHFQIKQRALFQPLRFQQAACRLKLFQPCFQLILYMHHSLFQRRARCHIMRIGIDAHTIQIGAFLTGQRVKFGQAVNFVAK